MIYRSLKEYSKIHELHRNTAKYRLETWRIVEIKIRKLGKEITLYIDIFYGIDYLNREIQKHIKCT